MMGKEKASKQGIAGVPQKHLHSRLSFLHQAASHLATTKDLTKTTDIGPNNSTKAARQSTQHSHDAARLLTQLRGVSRKAQIRLSPKVKHSICKRCDALLIPGTTSKESLVNSSKYGRKSTADILEKRCEGCATIKRFPVGLIPSEKPRAQAGS